MDVPQNPRIVMIDDEPAVLRTLESILDDRNWETSAFLDSKKALAFIEENPPDLILLDILMPEMNGDQLCEHLKCKGVKAPVIFISGIGGQEEKKRGFLAGGGDFITKPFYYHEDT